jgi:hypothetical protein
MLTPTEYNELVTIEAMAKTLLEKAAAFRKKAAPEEIGTMKKRKPSYQERNRADIQKRHEKMLIRLQKKSLNQ